MFLRPRIAASLARAEGQAYLLKTWLTKNAAHEWAHEARQLITEVDRFVEREKGPQNPSEAAALGLTVAALIDKASLPSVVKGNLVAVVSNAFALQLDNLSLPKSTLSRSAEVPSRFIPITATIRMDNGSLTPRSCGQCGSSTRALKSRKRMTRP